MDCYTVTVPDIERMMDRLALTHGFLDGHTPYHAAVLAMDNAERGEGFGLLLLKALRKLLELRVADPKGFDVTVLKTLCPEMTHADLAEAMTALHHAGWAHRARSREAVKRLAERFPELAALLRFDRRGGDRHVRVSGAVLLAEYERMVALERVKDRASRRAATRAGSICYELACRFNIRGRDGKPSWVAVENRIRRAKALPSLTARHNARILRSRGKAAAGA
jgi:hypothetical protein